MTTNVTLGNSPCILFSVSIFDSVLWSYGRDCNGNIIRYFWYDVLYEWASSASVTLVVESRKATIAWRHYVSWFWPVIYLKWFLSYFAPVPTLKRLTQKLNQSCRRYSDYIPYRRQMGRAKKKRNIKPYVHIARRYTTLVDALLDTHW